LDTPTGTAKATYVGFRPGLRVAIPVQYNAETRTADLGLLVGGGLEYRFGEAVGIFAEAIVSPYLTNDNLVPIEGRVGVTARF
jgi:hypothetical protein